MFQEITQNLPFLSVESHFCAVLLCIVLALVVCLSWATLEELRVLRRLFETWSASQGPTKSKNKEGKE